MNHHDINRALAEALGLPKYTTRAVLTLEVGELPKIEVESFFIAPAGARNLDPMEAAARVKSIPFVLRLEMSKHITPSEETNP